MTPIPSIRIPVTGKEGKSMRKPLIWATGLALAAVAAPAFAQSGSPGPKSVNIATNVPAFCQPAIWPGEQTMNVGSLVDSAGRVLDAFAGTRSIESGRYYCNAPSRMTLSATPLRPVQAVSVTDDGFTDKIDYVATVTWDDVAGTTDTTAAAPTPIVAAEANIGNVLLQLSSPSTAGNRRPVAGDYRGLVTITVALQ